MFFIFAYSKFIRRATNFHERGHFVQVFEKWGHVPHDPPVPTFRLTGLSEMITDSLAFNLYYAKAIKEVLQRRKM